LALWVQQWRLEELEDLDIKEMEALKLFHQNQIVNLMLPLWQNHIRLKLLFTEWVEISTFFMFFLLLHQFKNSNAPLFMVFVVLVLLVDLLFKNYSQITLILSKSIMFDSLVMSILVKATKSQFGNKMNISGSLLLLFKETKIVWLDTLS
jgi:hypothetical protein